MCGRYSLMGLGSRGLLGLPDGLGISRPNIAPGTLNAIATGLTGRKEPYFRYEAAIWGFTPARAKPGSRRQINARSETVNAKPYFREAFARQRVLVPSDGWYEWEVAGAGKQPVFIRRQFGKNIWFAGLGSPETGFCIITTAASRDLAAIHDRMPVVVRYGEMAAWLTSSDPAELLHILRPMPKRSFEFYRVDPRVNDPEYMSINCNQPIMTEMFL